MIQTTAEPAVMPFEVTIGDEVPKPTGCGPLATSSKSNVEEVPEGFVTWKTLKSPWVLLPSDIVPPLEVGT